MKKLDLKTGGHPLKNNDFMLMQSSYEEMSIALMSCLTSDSNVLMSGVVISSTSTTVSCTDGWAYYNNEIFKVQSTSFPFQTGKNLFFELIIDVLPPSPEEYKDANLQNVHIDRTLKLKYYVTGDQGEYYSSFTRISSLGFKRGMWFHYAGNSNLNFDGTGLGVNDMAGFAIMNGGTFTISGGNLYTVPDARGRSPIGTSNVPNTGAPGYDNNLGTYNLNEPYGASKVTLLQTNLPNINFTGNVNFTATSQLWSYEHRLQEGNPVRGISTEKHGRNEYQFNLTFNGSANVSLPSGGQGTPVNIVHPVLSGIPVIKL